MAGHGLQWRPTLEHLAREIGLDSLLLGYREATLFAPLAPLLTPMDQSLDAPFWSLHLELYGSLLILCLVTLRKWSPWLHRIAIAMCAIAFGTHPMFLFVLGHLFLSPPSPRGRGSGGGGARCFHRNRAAIPPRGRALAGAGARRNSSRPWPVDERRQELASR